MRGNSGESEFSEERRLELHAEEYGATGNCREAARGNGSRRLGN